jgi:hypothetical protein
MVLLFFGNLAMNGFSLSLLKLLQERRANERQSVLQRSAEGTIIVTSLKQGCSLIGTTMAIGFLIVLTIVLPETDRADIPMASFG